MGSGSGGFLVVKDMMRSPGGGGAPADHGNLAGVLVTFVFACLLSALGWGGTVLGLGLLGIVCVAELYQERLGKSRAWRNRALATMLAFVCLFVVGHLVVSAGLTYAAPTLQAESAELASESTRAYRFHLGGGPNADDGFSNNEIRSLSSMFGMALAVAGFRLLHARWLRPFGDGVDPLGVAGDWSFGHAPTWYHRISHRRGLAIGLALLLFVGVAAAGPPLVERVRSEAEAVMWGFNEEELARLGQPDVEPVRTPDPRILALRATQYPPVVRTERKVESARQRAQRLRARHGLGRVGGLSREWSIPELELLDDAMGRLSPAEHARVRGLQVMRRDQPIARSESIAGSYLSRERFARVVLFDGAFDSGCTWSGRCSAEEAAVSTVLHEVGHAIADRSRRAARRDLQRATAEVTELVQTWSDYHDETELLRSRRNRLDHLGENVDALNLEIAARQRSLDRRSETLARVRGQRSLLLAEYEAELEQSIVLRQYASVARGRAPTKYGRTNLGESFAEAFAMYHVAPNRLRSRMPEVHAWFAAGGHLVSFEAR